MERVTLLQIDKPIFKTARRYEFAYWMAFLSSIMLKCFYYQFTTQLNIKPFFSAKNIYMLVSSFGILLVITGLITLVSNRRRLTALFICDAVLSVLLITDTNFFRYYYGIITIPVITQIDIRLLSSVDQSIMSLFKIKDILLIIDLPLMLAAIILLYKRGIDKLQIARKVIIGIAAIAVGFTSFFIVYRSADINAFAYNSNYRTKSLGILYSHIDSVKRYIKENVFESKSLTAVEKSEIDDFFSSKEKTSENFRGIARGKNLIVVQMEAMQEFLINRKINGKEITPNLNKLVKDSLYLNNFYFQVADGNTSDAEFLLNTSLYPAKEGSAFLRFADNTYYSLPKVLKEQGYKSYALHAFTAEFWNRTEMYKAIGFDKFINSKDFVMDEFAGWEGDALSDASFFRQSLDKIDMSNPFYSFLITLSTHHPFKYFTDYSYNVGELQGSYMGSYIKAANYADSCLGQFIEDLKKRGLYDSTLLVVYGDHSAVPKLQSDGLMEFLGVQYSELEWAKLQKVPCIIHYPGLRNGEIESTTGGEIDLFPTIANLMSIDYPYFIGKDILNSEKGYVVLRNGSVMTDSYAYINNTRDIFDIKNGKRLSRENYEPELNSLLYQLYISDLIIEKNAFKSISKTP